MGNEFASMQEVEYGLSEEQKTLLSMVCGPFIANGEPVVYQYIDRRMKRMGMDAGSALSSLPYIQSATADRRRYSLLHYDAFSPLRKDLEIQPTVAGLYACGLTDGIGATMMFLHVVGLFQKTHDSSPASPHTVAAIRILDRIIDLETPSQLLTPYKHLLEPLAQFEPPTQGCSKLPAPEEPIDLEWDISNFYAAFSHEPTIDEYILQVQAMIAPPGPFLPEVTASPLELSAALDYLDTVWALTFQDKLVSIPNGERLTKLAFPANSEDELASRLSGLTELWKALNVPSIPGVGGDALQRMPAFIKSKLPDVDDELIQGAVDVLIASTHIRNGLQHGTAGRKFTPALKRFDLPFPVRDHREAWLKIRAQAVQALTTIREGIQQAAV